MNRALVHASNNVPSEKTPPNLPFGGEGCFFCDNTVVFCCEFDSASGTFKSERVLAKPIVVKFHAIKTNGYRAQTRSHKFFEAFLGQSQSIGDHTPRIAALLECCTHFGEVLAHQRFATRDDYQHLMRIDMRRDRLINHTEEVFGGHVGCDFATRAVTTTMQAMHIAAERRLPKELLQRMQLLKVLAT